MKKHLFLCIALCLSAAGASGAEETLTWTPEYTVRSLWAREAVPNNIYEDDAISDTRLRSAQTVRFNDAGILVKADGEWRIETRTGLDTETLTSTRWRELYAQMEHERHRFSIGQQVVTWGVLDNLSIIDRVNPQDQTYFILYDKQERKQPVWMLRHQYATPETTLETIYMPFFRPDTVTYFDQNLSWFDHLKQGVRLGPYTNEAKTTVADIGVVDRDNPHKGLHSGQFGIRLRRNTAAADYSLYYLNAFHTTPTLREQTPVGNTVKQFLYIPTLGHLADLLAANPTSTDLTLTAEHPRVNTVGMDWETVIRSFGVRGEVAMAWGRPFVSRDLAYTTKDIITAGLGIDRTLPHNVYINIQWVQEYIFHYTDLYGQQQAPHYLTGRIRQTFCRDIWQAILDWRLNLTYRDWMLHPRITYMPSDFFQVTGGATIFQDSDTSTMFGHFDSNDMIYFMVTLKF